MVISLTAKGLTTGEVEAHLAEVYSTTISRETISKITDRVLGELAEWQTRPLDRATFAPCAAENPRDPHRQPRPVQPHAAAPREQSEVDSKPRSAKHPRHACTRKDK